MARYIFAYHSNGKRPESPEAGAAMMEQWQAWLAALGAAVIEPNNPLGKSSTVSEAGVEDNGGSNPLMGYTIVEAESQEAAIEMAKGSPFLAMGTIEVAEIKQMNR